MELRHQRVLLDQARLAEKGVEVRTSCSLAPLRADNDKELGR